MQKLMYFYFYGQTKYMSWDNTVCIETRLQGEQANSEANPNPCDVYQEQHC